MNLTLSLDEPLATQLRREASARHLAPEQVAHDLLGRALARIAEEENWRGINQRRGELIRKRREHGLTAEESINGRSRWIGTFSLRPSNSANSPKDSRMQPIPELPSGPVVFVYPDTAHVRRHGPRGYVDDEHYKPWLRDEFTFRCLYCCCREVWFPDGDRNFSVEHLQPTSLAPEGLTDYDTLVYACCQCNAAQKAILLPPTTRSSATIPRKTTKVGVFRRRSSAAGLSRAQRR
jgi:hypothetical protein